MTETKDPATGELVATYMFLFNRVEFESDVKFGSGSTSTRIEGDYFVIPGTERVEETRFVSSIKGDILTESPVLEQHWSSYPGGKGTTLYNWDFLIIGVDITPQGTGKTYRATTLADVIEVTSALQKGGWEFRLNTCSVYAEHMKSRLRDFMQERDAFHTAMEGEENPSCYLWQDGLEHFDHLYPYDGRDETEMARDYYCKYGFRGIRKDRPNFQKKG